MDGKKKSLPATPPPGWIKPYSNRAHGHNVHSPTGSRRGSVRSISGQFFHNDLKASLMAEIAVGFGRMLLSAGLPHISRQRGGGD